MYIIYHEQGFVEGPFETYSEAQEYAEAFYSVMQGYVILPLLKPTK